MLEAAAMGDMSLGGHLALGRTTAYTMEVDMHLARVSSVLLRIRIRINNMAIDLRQFDKLLLFGNRDDEIMRLEVVYFCSKLYQGPVLMLMELHSADYSVELNIAGRALSAFVAPCRFHKQFFSSHPEQVNKKRCIKRGM
jgi:hypothetical protein